MSENDESAIHDILVFLRNQTGRHFMHYKRATVLRRIARHIARRMQVSSLQDMIAIWLSCASITAKRRVRRLTLVTRFWH